MKFQVGGGQGLARCGALPHFLHGVQQGQRLGDLAVLPAAAVLVGEEDQPAVGTDACLAPGVLEQLERQQRGEGRVLGAQRPHRARQPQRLAGQVGAQQVADLRREVRVFARRWPLPGVDVSTLVRPAGIEEDD